MLLLGVLGGPAVALAGEPNCDTFITSAPYAISAPGHYCLAGDLAYASTTGSAIRIDADAVVLDLRGYTIGGPADLGATAMGVRVSNQSNVVVRNGLVRGFFIGIAFDGDAAGTSNSNNLVEGIRADGNARSGIWVSEIGSNNTVRDCIVASTGGTTATTSSTPSRRSGRC